jgi:hypothetical protein
VCCRGLASFALALATLSACGRDEAAPTEWCVTTTRLMYVLDQHSTTAEYKTLDEWRELSPDDIRPQADRAAAVLSRYPVDAKNRELVAAREEIEACADDRCPEETRTYPPSTTPSS